MNDRLVPVTVSMPSGGIDAFVASTRINRYELGIHRPDLLTVRKLAKVLDVPVAFFLALSPERVGAL